jgi:thiamine pyrophosphokinase
VICCGGKVGSWCIPILENADVRIGADKGAMFVVENNFYLDFAVGDFDSVDSETIHKIKQNSAIFDVVDAVDKNDTDSGLAIKQAISIQPSMITIIGATGSRYDHVLNNIQLLTLAEEADIPCEIIDLNNRIRMVSPKSSLTIAKSNYKYVSIIPISDLVSGITITGFKYPLHDATFTIGKAYGISNELLEKQGTVTVKHGLLLVIESND